jgi:hypothetical protein
MRGERSRASDWQPTQWEVPVYARLTMVTGDPQRVDDLVAFVESDVRPAVEAQPGSRGVALFVNRASGAGGVCSFFGAAEDRDASAPVVKGLRDKAVELIEGTATVENFEVAVFNRIVPPGPGAWLRIVRTHNDDLSTVDAAIEQFKTITLPALTTVPGLCSVLLFTDRETGNAATSTSWADASALGASRDTTMNIRSEALARSGLSLISVEEYELIFTTAQPG